MPYFPHLIKSSHKQRAQRKETLRCAQRGTAFYLSRYNTNSLSKTVLSVKPLFKRFQRFEKPLYDM
ncbi:MAG: hypothetical protein BWK80_21065, partial [Desulfobacteraceae bacterium IS3]